VKRGGLWAKHMGGAIGNTLGEPIGNLKGNMLGTNKKMKKTPPPPLCTPHPKLKKKKTRQFESMLSPPIGCMK